MPTNSVTLAALDMDGVPEEPDEPVSTSQQLERLQTATSSLETSPTFEHAKAACMAARSGWWMLWVQWNVDQPLKDLLATYAGLMKRILTALVEVGGRLDSDQMYKLKCYQESCRARWTFARSLAEEGIVAAERAMDEYRERMKQPELTPARCSASTN